MDKIKTWLKENRSFEEGIELFRKHSRNKHIEGYLTRKRDRAQLRYELEKIALGGCSPVAASPLSVPALPEKPQERLKGAYAGGIRVDDMPQSVKTIYLEVCELYKKMRAWHEKMKLAASDSARAALRRELVEMEARRVACWGIIDRWHNDGILPDEESAAASSPTTDPKALVSARAAITRNLGLLVKATDPEGIDGLKARLDRSVDIVIASGGGFGKNAEILKRYGLLL